MGIIGTRTVSVGCEGSTTENVDGEGVITLNWLAEVVVASAVVPMTLGVIVTVCVLSELSVTVFVTV
jgi:hypothetical protein